jgi:hypothetical protein
MHDSFEIHFITHIFKNIMRQLFDGESHQVLKITVPYFTLPLGRKGSAIRDCVLCILCMVHSAV